MVIDCHFERQREIFTPNNKISQSPLRGSFEMTNYQLPFTIHQLLFSPFPPILSAQLLARRYKVG